MCISWVRLGLFIDITCLLRNLGFTCLMNLSLLFKINSKSRFQIQILEYFHITFRGRILFFILSSTEWNESLLGRIVNSFICFFSAQNVQKFLYLVYSYNKFPLSSLITWKNQNINTLFVQGFIKEATFSAPFLYIVCPSMKQLIQNGKIFYEKVSKKYL